MSIRMVFVKRIFLRKKWLFIGFGSFSTPGQLFAAGLSKSHGTCLWEEFNGCFSLIKYCFSNNIEPWAKGFRHLSKCFWRGCQNCIVRLLRINLRKGFHSVRNTQYLLIKNLTLLETFSRFCKKVFSTVVITYLCVLGNILRKTFNFRETSIFLRHFRCKAKHFPTNLTKVQCTCPRNISRENFCFSRRKSFFLTFSDIERVVFGLLLEFCCQGWQNFSSFTYKPLDKKHFYWEQKVNHFCFFSRQVRQLVWRRCELCILPFYRNVLTDFFSVGKKTVIEIFGQWAKNFRSCIGAFLT